VSHDDVDAVEKLVIRPKNLEDNCVGVHREIVG
jgi:hypothetical protein